jgi:hypothetical protein
MMPFYPAPLFAAFSKQMLSPFDYGRSKIADPGPSVQASSKDVEHFNGGPIFVGWPVMRWPTEKDMI